MNLALPLDNASQKQYTIGNMFRKWQNVANKITNFLTSKGNTDQRVRSCINEHH